MTADLALCVRDYAPGARMGAHSHDAPWLSIVLDGGFQERVGDEDREYAAGHLSLLPSGARHAQAFGRDGARQVLFRPRAAWIGYLSESHVEVDASPHARSTAFQTLGRRLRRECEAADACAELAREALMLEIIAAFGRGRRAAAQDRTPPDWLCRARDFIHDTAPDPLSLADVARAAGRHEIHLAREFRRHFGNSVGAYARDLRLDHAARLLTDGDLALTEIALACGFATHAHFCRAFKARFGVTPSASRAAARG